MLTRGQTYALIVFFLLFMLVPIWFFLIPFDPDLGYGIFSNIVGMIGTVILLMYVIETRDNHEWKPVKQKVYDRIGIELEAILSLFLHLYKVTWTACTPPMIGIRIRDLVWLWSEETSDIEFAKALKDSAKTELSGGKYLETFETERRLLNEIETKYSRFMNPDLVLSLMEIQNNLLRIIIYNSNLLRRVNHQDSIFEKISMKAHGIVKEAYKIHKRMGIEIIHPDSFLDYHY